MQWPLLNPFTTKAPESPRETLLRRLAEGVPPELAVRAAGVELATLENDAEAQKAIAEGEISLFEKARDQGVTGVIRAAMRREASSWLPKAEPPNPQSLEDLLRG